MSYIKKILSFFLNRLLLLDNVILFKMSDLREVDSPVTVKKADYDNITDILNFQETKYLNIFKEFLAKGDRGYLGYLNDKCIHRSWVIVESGSIVNLHPLVSKKIKEDEIYIHYCETAPSARGKNVYPYVLCTIVKEFNDKNILICVNHKNIPSIKGIKKVGFKPVQSITIFALFGVVFRFKKDLKGDEF